MATSSSPDGSPEGDKNEGQRKIYRELAPYMGLSSQMVATLVVFGLLGWWIDSEFQTSPVWLIILLVIGVVVAMVGFIRTALKAK
ncbi:MAG: AtpZ/AtpI family protein [Ignavibacteriae bacterium]|nr:AtpZ/AtpI family protein [Ignavibacteriota bacterium]